MAYTAQGSLLELATLSEMKQLFVSHGLDLDHSRQRPAVLTHALALLYHLPDHTKRNRQLEMDGSGHAPFGRSRDRYLHGIYSCR